LASLVKVAKVYHGPMGTRAAGWLLFFGVGLALSCGSKSGSGTGGACPHTGYTCDCAPDGFSPTTTMSCKDINAEVCAWEASPDPNATAQIPVAAYYCKPLPTLCCP
jgi:hypothetical protein